jgi:NAD dependent epimerase/dehydratase
MPSDCHRGGCHLGIAGKRVLVTGAGGFIGSHLVELLVARGAEVRALVNYNSFNFRGWLERSPLVDQIEVVSGDIRDSYLCERFTRDQEIVFHLAALIAIPYSYTAPDSYVDTNIKGTLNMCHASLRARVQRYIQLSTSEVYGTARYVPIDEQHPLQPQSPYAASKAGADAIAYSFHRSYDLPLVVARPFNSYGPRQSARAIIPTIISQLVAKSHEVHLGETAASRDFTYVEDTCGGLVSLAESDGVVGEAFNIGSNSETTVEGLFTMIAEIMGAEAQIVFDRERLRPSASEVTRLKCDNHKIETACGFQPRVPLADGLRKTIDWFNSADNRNFYKSSTYNV